MRRPFKPMWWFAAAIPTVAIVSTPVFAQTPPVSTLPTAAVRPIQDPGQQLIDQQREQARQRRLEQPPAAVSLPSSAPEGAPQIAPDTPIDSIAETGPTFRIRHIDVQGNTVLPASRINAITAPFEAE